MHILSAVFFAFSFMLAIGVIATMLASHADRIATALCGDAFFPRRIVTLVNFRSHLPAKAAANDAGYRVVRKLALAQLPLAA
jgi:hypothetical protein